jgi:hypothetical protein
MRKLASVQRILRIDPIEGADKISVATILGWQVVVAKADNFKIGDLVVYIEVDSILPPMPEFLFLQERKYRVRTIKLRGQISQGLVVGMAIVSRWNKSWKEGDDVTELLGITKYESDSDAEQNATVVVSKNPIVKFMMRFAWFRKYFGTKKEDKGFPKFISKTDEDRIQIHPDWLEKYSELNFEVTEKLDGQSATYALVKKGKKYEFIVCSRTQRLVQPDNSNWWKIAKKHDIENLLHELIGGNEWVAIQGEIVGTGIQGNKYGFGISRLFVFQFLTPEGKFSPISVDAILARFGVECVPLVSYAIRLPKTVSEMVDYARGMKSLLNKNVLREGVVIRNYKYGVSFKVINPDFLLKNER